MQMDPIELLNLKPHSKTLHNVFKTDRLSDHSPVSMMLHYPATICHDTSPTIPAWIYKHDQFSNYFHQLLDPMMMTKCPIQEFWS